MDITTDTAISPIVPNTNRALLVGSSSIDTFPAGGAFIGDIDELYIWGQAISPSQITLVMAGPITTTGTTGSPQTTTGSIQTTVTGTTGSQTQTVDQTSNEETTNQPSVVGTEENSSANQILPLFCCLLSFFAMLL